MSLEPLLMQLEGLIAALALVFGLLILWILVSIPVWIAAKIVTVGKARFTRAMLVTAAGPTVYAIVFFLSSAILEMTLGEKIFISTVAFILAFIAWIGVFKLGFDTGWLRALGIAILATIVFAVIGTIITIGLQALIPETPPITPFPTF
ncbi:hypothetical protein [Nitrososphaera viennensis]|uniref:Uncharacterized protein n=2 Tax=Nitrososphaera viennensis TaxID=1034015 RepID=A0A060HL53_9ARCH|nr:hypothetical protein [Nitrososphaera viennensis]AIC15910.1 hypothetical protein NVIE_016570 [Nitrososphaera viennensis EN76]UVS67897.1 hypothetical protein NWT39_08255 [Nitrososphaera viennensis]